MSTLSRFRMTQLQQHPPRDRHWVIRTRWRTAVRHSNPRRRMLSRAYGLALSMVWNIARARLSRGLRLFVV